MFCENGGVPGFRLPKSVLMMSPPNQATFPEPHKWVVADQGLGLRILLSPGNKGMHWVFPSAAFLTTLSGASKLSCSGATPVTSQWAKERSRQDCRASPLWVGVLWTEEEVPQALTSANTVPFHPGDRKKAHTVDTGLPIGKSKQDLNDLTFCAFPYRDPVKSLSANHSPPPFSETWPC